MQGHGRIIAHDFCIAHREANSGLSTLNRTKSILSIYHQQRQLQKQRGMCLNDTYPFCQQPLSSNCHSICFSKPVLWTATPWRLFYLVREMGLEPTHHRYWLLRPARLPFRHSRRDQPLSYHEKGPAVKSPATKEVWRWLCGGSTGISPPALRSNGHQPAFTCRFAILPTSPAASGDHPVKTVTSLIFWNPSPA